MIMITGIMLYDNNTTDTNASNSTPRRLPSRSVAVTARVATDGTGHHIL